MPVYRYEPDHIRHIVTVHGQKPPYDGNEDYYAPLVDIPVSLSAQKRTVAALWVRVQEPNDAIVDIVSPSRQFAEELSDIIRGLGMYERVEVRTENLSEGVWKNQN